MRYFFLLMLFSSISFAQRDVKDFAIHLSAKIDSSAGLNIELNWQHDPDAIYYTVYRKLKHEDEFQLIKEFYDNVDSFIDSNVKQGILYEYKVDKFGEWINPNSNKEEDWMGWGYICAGTDVNFDYSPSKILILIDDVIYPQLTSEIADFKKDLISDRWEVLIRTVPRVETFDFEKVQQTKELVKQIYEDEKDLKTIFLIGRVPIPFSGFYTPDGHKDDNSGAWPTDMYYADIDGFWSDDTVNAFTPNFEWHINTKGDGKFDNITIPSDTELEVARLDFYDLDFFEESEIELFKRYFRKDHAFRTGQIKFPMKAIIDDGFTFAHDEMFASSPWMNFSAILGRENISYNTGIREVLKWSQYTFTSAIASGAISNIFERAYAPEYAEFEQLGIIGQFFGSYAIEWYTSNNMLRSALASEPSFLISYWGGRPYWYLHYLGVGETIGYCAKLSQNNDGLYESNQEEKHLRQVHIALMGDPTLRLYNDRPPQNVVAFFNPDDQENKVRLSWLAGNSDDRYYNVYYAPHLDSSFTRLNFKPIRENEFYHYNVDDRANGYWYVTAISKEETNSGSFWNESIGGWADIISSIEERFEFRSYYDPITNTLNTELEPRSKIEIFSSLGDNVFVGEVDLNGQLKLPFELTTGSYFVRSFNKDKYYISKFIISL